MESLRLAIVFGNTWLSTDLRNVISLDFNARFLKKYDRKLKRVCKQLNITVLRNICWRLICKLAMETTHLCLLWIKNKINLRKCINIHSVLVIKNNFSTFQYKLSCYTKNLFILATIGTKKIFFDLYSIFIPLLLSRKLRDSRLLLLDNNFYFTWGYQWKKQFFISINGSQNTTCNFVISNGNTYFCFQYSIELLILNSTV